MITIRAHISHGSYRKTLEATAATVSDCIIKLASENSYIPTPEFSQYSQKLIKDLETTGSGAMGWAEYAVVEPVKPTVKPQIIITIEGGVIQDVSASVPIDYMTIDFDIDGADRNLCEVPQKDGKETAIVHDCETGPDNGVIKLARNLRKQLKEIKP